MAEKKVHEFLYEEDYYKIRGSCFNVYNVLGGGIKENIIARALSKELSVQGLEIENQVRIDVFYLNEKIGTYIPDIVVNSKIIIELKSKPFLTNEDEKQFWGYLKGSNYKLGFLINFSPQKLIIKRFVYTK
jgi:GxxExxY protein